MASKKNLSDLLREEVSKGPQSTPSDSEVTPAQSSSEHESTSENALTIASTAELSEQTAKTATVPKISLPKNLSRLTKAELEKKIHQLHEGLQASQAKEVALQEQVSGLEATTEAQSNSIQDLQAALTQAQSLKTELEQTRKDALRLAQENERLQTQIQGLQKEAVNLKVSPEQPARQPSTRSRSILDRPIIPAHSPTRTKKSSKNFDTWCYD